MAFYTGRTGALYLTSTGTGDVTPAASEQALKLRDWSLETTVELLETTTVDTAVKSYTPGSSSASGRSEEHTSELQSPCKSRMPSSA